MNKILVYLFVLPLLFLAACGGGTGPTIITGLSISGDSEIGENSSDDYTATATYSDGSNQTVTPTWSEDSSYASVNSGGTVTTDSVTSDQSFTLTATYSDFTATKSITIKDVDGGVGGYNGWVLESGTDIPISGADVSAGGISDVTDINGAFDLQNIPIGSQTLSVQATGYLNVDRPITVEEGETILTSVYMAPIDDHGDNCASATSVSTNTTASGNIETGGDYDYFSVSIASSGTLNVYTSGSTDTYGYLYNSSCTQIASNDDSGSGYNFSISNSVNSGTYYVAVRHFNNISGTGIYTLEVTFTGDPIIITGLSISGDSEIGENSSDDYTATATYSDGSSQTVTPTWSENSDYASVNSGGKVTTDSVTSDQTFTLTATYSGLTATKSITIKDGGGGGGANKFGEAKWGTGRWE